MRPVDEAMGGGESPVITGPGAKLRQAREALKLSQHAISMELHLRPDQVRALESDDYAALPEGVYVRGYLRAYARRVGLSPEEILADYQRAVPVEPPMPLPPGTATRAQRVRLQWLSYIFVLVLLGVAGTWWYSQQQSPSSAPEAGDESAASPSPPAAPQQVLPQAVTEAAVPDEPGPEPVAPDVGDTPRQLPGASEVDPTMPATSDSAPAVLQQAEPPAAATADEVSRAADAGTTEAAVQSRTELTAAPESQPVMLLVFREKSWAEISDAQGNRLIYDLISAGTSRVVRGRVPFKVFLGNARAVTIKYNGQPFDATPYLRGRVARFEVGEAGDLGPRPAR